MPNEEKAIVLDYLPTGKSDSFKSEPAAQVLGTEFFTLLEVVPKTPLKAMEEIYVGKEEREKIDYIKKRISFSELTSNSTLELDKAIEKLVKEKEKKFVEFFNVSRSITIRRHQLELLPGLGKKHMVEILDERKKKPFESFEDIEKRVHLMPKVLQILVKRIMLELEDEDLKHFLFARPPQKAHTPF